MFTKAEGNDLKYIRINQKKLRVESYVGLSDYVHGLADEQGLKPGKMFIFTVIVYWKSEKYAAKLSGRNGFSTKIWITRFFHYVYLQSKLAGNS